MMVSRVAAREAVYMALEVRDRRALKQVGANIRAERGRRGWTQDDLGNACDLGQQVISDLEHAKVEGGVTRYIRIARALEVPIESLFARVDGLDQNRS
jgi:transcriptional regulator with XRE-family HTH domain